MHCLSPFFFMEAKFGPIEKRIKTIDVGWDGIFQNSQVHLFWPQKEWINSGRAESRTSWREDKKMQMKLAATCNEKEKQHDAKNHPGL